MKPNKLIGKCINIIDKESQYYNHYGYIIAYDGLYHVSGGSIASSEHELTIVLDRNQFKIRKIK